MRLDTLSIVNYRNVEETDIAPGSGINVFYGNNGEGKTNFLEAIFYLGTLHSFRTAKTEDLIRWGEPSAILGATLESGGNFNGSRILLDRHGRRVKVNGKGVGSYAEYCSLLSVVLFTPEEISLGRNAPESRRRYLNRAIIAADVGYISRYQEMARILKQRNALLRSASTGELEVWTDRFSEASATLVQRRLAFIEEINPLLAAYYGELAGGDRAEIRYIPSWKADEDDDAASAQSLRQALASREREELLRQTTLVGPHRDEIAFLLNGRALKHHASQGEQRSFIIALKMAEIELVRRTRGEPPILLLDDLTSELDPTRNRNLFDYLRRMELQVFITTTSHDALANLGSDAIRYFRVSHGQFQQEV